MGPQVRLVSTEPYYRTKRKKKGDDFNIRTLLLLNCKLVFVVTKIFPSKEKGEFWIILLFLHSHLFELWSIAGHKLGQFVNDISKLLVCEDTKDAQFNLINNAKQ